MKRTIQFALLSWLLLSVSLGLAQEQKLPKHLVDAKELVNHLDLKNTSYQHGDPRITWTGTRESQADCSGFLDALLMHSYGYDRAAFKRWFDSTRLTAARYHRAIVEQRGFTEIKKITEVRPGDILAVEYLTRKDNTGHVMLVSEAARLMKPKAPLIADTDQWEVPVIDSSQSGHGLTDTRHAKGSDGKDHDGLGRGILRIYADKQGKVAGFAWSTLAASKFKSPQDEHLVIGRLKANFQP